LFQGSAVNLRHLSSISCHVALVFRKCSREEVSTMVVANEVEKFIANRIDRGVD
jgi:hypothetical protein